MEDLFLHQKPDSDTEIIATGGNFKVEYVKYIGNSDYDCLIEISDSLVEEYGEHSRLTSTTIQKYFNKNDSHPFIARHQGSIVGYIIGIPLEALNQEPWARLDTNFHKNNTIYTYAFVIKKEYKENGYAKTLKSVYLNWVRKQPGILYVTGHVKKGISSRFKGNITLIKKIDNWQGTGRVFEYYRRELDPEKIYNLKTNSSKPNRIC